MSSPGSENPLDARAHAGDGDGAAVDAGAVSSLEAMPAPAETRACAIKPCAALVAPGSDYCAIHRKQVPILTHQVGLRCRSCLQVLRAGALLDAYSLRAGALRHYQCPEKPADVEQSQR